MAMTNADLIEKMGQDQIVRTLRRGWAQTHGHDPVDRVVREVMTYGKDINSTASDHIGTMIAIVSVWALAFIVAMKAGVIPYQAAVAGAIGIVAFATGSNAILHHLGRARGMSRYMRFLSDRNVFLDEAETFMSLIGLQSSVMGDRLPEVLQERSDKALRNAALEAQRATLKSKDKEREALDAYDELARLFNLFKIAKIDRSYIAKVQEEEAAAEAVPA
ncbi:MAG TPA: hypothetical protein VHD69_02365 [Candidatus Paceibacterota bacterium]|jgi:hypothetical protein|nr:hypothetical protein [Candidatus Paceibacterota bacterium]